MEAVELPCVVFTVSVFPDRTTCHTQANDEQVAPIVATDKALAAIEAEKRRILACPSHRRWLAAQKGGAE